MRCLNCLLILGLFLIGCDGISHTRRPITRQANRKGVHLLLDDGRFTWPQTVWPEHLGYARQAVGEWGYVTQLVRLDDLDPVKWQRFMAICADLHLTPILRLATTYDQTASWWTAPPPDKNGHYITTARRYADFAAALDWPTNEHYLVVGNEPNHGDEWNGRPDPAAYARFLIDTAVALHQTDPAARVFNAGFDTYTPHTGSQPFNKGLYYMDAETFLDEMFAAEPTVFEHLDGWASHPYPPGPFVAPPEEQLFQVDWLNDANNPAHVVPPPGIFNRGINSYEWEIWKLAGYGIVDLPVFITETGWRHTADGYPDQETAARYLDWAGQGNGQPDAGWTPWQQDDRVFAVTPFALDGNPAEWWHTNWLELAEDGTVVHVLPLFTAWRDAH